MNTGASIREDRFAGARSPCNACRRFRGRRFVHEVPQQPAFEHRVRRHAIGAHHEALADLPASSPAALATQLAELLPPRRRFAMQQRTAGASRNRIPAAASDSRPSCARSRACRRDIASSPRKSASSSSTSAGGMTGRGVTRSVSRSSVDLGLVRDAARATTHPRPACDTNSQNAAVPDVSATRCMRAIIASDCRRVLAPVVEYPGFARAPCAPTGRRSETAPRDA